VLGGVENWIRQINFNQIPFSSPADFAFMEFGMPVRGWEIGRGIGNNFFLTNAELRFPLFYGLLAGPVPIPLQGVQGTMFFDMGGAWNNGQAFVSARPDENGNLTTRDLLMSAGVGMRSFVLGLPLRVDVAWRNLYWNWSQPLWMFSIGGDW
jgi:outer membrane protein assembly factor BamA